MADSLNQKSPKTGDKPKPCNVVHRTTSETIRLGEPERNVNPPPTSLTSGTSSIKKKTPSFQITSVTVNSRMSNDGGDDSADDLDESHTEDNSDVIDSSKITDIENETPSFSEDTFSKDDIFFNPSAASLGTAPVIPTSSQYGLAIVSEGAGGAGVTGGVAGANTIGSGVTCSDLHVSVSDNVININTKSEERDTVTNRNERFKVVKIESTEPFKRGRWVCMDFLDHSNTSSSIVKETVGKEDSLVCGVPTAVGESAVEPTIVVGDLGIVGGVDFGGVKSTLPDHRNPPGGPGPPSSALPPHLSGFPQVPPHQSMPGMGPMHASTQQYYQPAQSVGVAGFEQNAGASAASVQTLPSIHHPQQSQQVPQSQPGVVSTTQGQNIVGMVQQQPQIPNGTTTSGVTVGSTVSTQTSMGTGHGVLPTQQQSMVQGMPLPQQQQVHPQPMTSQGSGYVSAPQPNMAQHAQQQQGNIGPFIHMQQQPPQPSAIPQVGQQQGMTQAQTQQHQHPQHQQHQQPQLQQPQHQQHPPQTQGGYITVQQQQNQQNLVQQQPQPGINQQHQPHPGYVTGQSVPQQAMAQPTGFVQAAGQSLQGQPNYIPQVKQPTQQQSQPPVQGFMPQQQQQQPQQQAMQPSQHPQSQQQPAAYMGVPSQGQPSPQQQQTAAFLAQQQVPQGQNQGNAQVMTSAGQSQPVPQPQMTYMPPQQKSQPASMPHQPAYIQQTTQGPQVGFVNPQAQVSQQQGQSYQHTISHHPQQEQGIMNEDPSLITVDHHVEAMVNAPTNGGVMATDDGVPVAVSQVAPVVVQPSSAQGGAEDAESFMGLARALASSSSSASSSSASTAVPTPAPAPPATHPPATSSPSAPMIPAVATATSNNPPPPGPPPTPAQPPQQPPATAAPRPASPLPAFVEADKFISASGTSAVAIDNKIEQAMDLVKSHLMFAVREEVEVLKEKIAELMERINQLEVENSILKAHASTETLAQLGGGGAGGGGQAVVPPAASMQMQAQGQQQAS